MNPERGAAVVLAAGSSQRFGTDKRLAEVNDQPMIVRALQPYLAQLHSVYVVLRPKDPVRVVLPPEICVIEAPNAHLGMGHSLAAAAEQLTEFKWILVGLADMPWINSDTIAQIVARINTLEKAIVRPSYGGKSGHPVAFTADYLNELKTLTGDVGARDVVSRNRSRLIDLDVTDKAILRDVDTPTQLSK